MNFPHLVIVVGLQEELACLEVVPSLLEVGGYPVGSPPGWRLIPQPPHTAPSDCGPGGEERMGRCQESCLNQTQHISLRALQTLITELNCRWAFSVKKLKKYFLVSYTSHVCTYNTYIPTYICTCIPTVLQSPNSKRYRQLGFLFAGEDRVQCILFFRSQLERGATKIDKHCNCSWCKDDSGEAVRNGSLPCAVTA